MQDKGKSAAAERGEASVAGFAPTAVRYVKLGRGGGWSARAFAEGIIPFGFQEVDHGICERRDWAAIRSDLIASGKSPSAASQWVREIRAIYEQGVIGRGMLTPVSG